jgi:hypothetical protein
MVSLGGLKQASDLRGKVKELFTEVEIIAMAKGHAMPHYVLTNPVTKEVHYLFNAAEVNEWVTTNCLEQKEYHAEQTLVFHHFNADAHGIELGDVIPKELHSIKGLYKIPLEILSSPPGVYFLCQKGEIVYIGQSLNVAQRIITHRKEGFKEFDSAFYIQCHISHLDHFEMALIRYFRPKFNAQKIGSKSIDDIALFQSICDESKISMNQEYSNPLPVRLLEEIHESQRDHRE